MSLSEKRIERVARAICAAARCDQIPECPWCKDNNGICVEWKLFQKESIAAIAAMKGY